MRSMMLATIFGVMVLTIVATRFVHAALPDCDGTEVEKIKCDWDYTTNEVPKGYFESQSCEDKAGSDNICKYAVAYNFNKFGCAETELPVWNFETKQFEYSKYCSDITSVDQCTITRICSGTNVKTEDGNYVKCTQVGPADVRNRLLKGQIDCNPKPAQFTQFP